jgi:hypothetical protein
LDPLLRNPDASRASNLPHMTARVFYCANQSSGKVDDGGRHSTLCQGCPSEDRRSLFSFWQDPGPYCVIPARLRMKRASGTRPGPDTWRPALSMTFPGHADPIRAYDATRP